MAPVKSAENKVRSMHQGTPSPHTHTRKAPLSFHATRRGSNDYMPRKEWNTRSCPSAGSCEECTHDMLWIVGDMNTCHLGENKYQRSNYLKTTSQTNFSSGKIYKWQRNRNGDISAVSDTPAKNLRGSKHPQKGAGLTYSIGLLRSFWNVS